MTSCFLTLSWVCFLTTVFFGADVGETLMKAVSQALTGLSAGISGQEGSTHGVLMSTHLGQEITFTPFERPFK